MSTSKVMNVVSLANPTNTPLTTSHALNSAARDLLAREPLRAQQFAYQAYLNAQSLHNHQSTAESLWLLGQISQQLEHFDEANGYFEHAKRLFKELELTEQHADCCIQMADNQIRLGNLKSAREQLEAGLALGQQHGLPRIEAAALNKLAQLENQSGNPLNALELLERTLEIRHLLGDGAGTIAVLNNLAIIYTDLGQYQQALEYLMRVTTLIHDTNAQEWAFHCFTGIGNIYEALGEYNRSLTYHEKALQISRERQEQNNQALAKLNLAVTHQYLENHTEALRLLEQARQIGQQLGLVRIQAASSIRLSISLNKLGQLERALCELQANLVTVNQLGDIQLQLETLMALATTQDQLGDAAQARVLYQTVLSTAQQHGYADITTNAHQQLANLFETSDPSQALKHFKAYHQTREEVFKQRDRTMRDMQVRLETIAMARANAALEDKVRERTSEREATYIEMLERLAHAAEYRDDDTGKHTERVGRLSGLIATELGWSNERTHLLERAATLHDIGKIGIPDSILLKPGRFTPEEFDRMKAHTSIGANILSGGRSPLIQLAESIALSHHERWDGTGYPQKLTADNIPMEGRIVSIADVYDALTSARPYKAAWTEEQAIQEIQAQSGRQFDPKVVEAFLRVIANLDC
jgi:HD-GYP domain-containing protein (c-di-GMP phosphodiesterase class II)